MTDSSRGKRELEAMRAQGRAPKVFVSYSHESARHKNWVLRLASDLRKRGVDAILDLWDLKPGQDVATFMEHLASVDRVVIVCSEGYARKAAAGKGGVGYETMLVTAEIPENRGVVKFIPILRDNPAKALPSFLRTRYWLDFQNDAEYGSRLEELARALLDAPAHQKPDLGTSPFGTGSRSVRDVFAEEWFRRHRDAAMLEVQRRGAFMEVGFGAAAEEIRSDHRALLNIAERSAVHTFGWPIGVVLHTEEGRPFPDHDGIVARIGSRVFSDYERYDYWSLRLNGDFYIAQNLFENQIDPKAIFFNTRMIRVAEALLYCRNLYVNLGVEAGRSIRFRLRHSGFKGRILSTSNPNRLWPAERRASADSAETPIEFSHPLSDRGIVETTRELLDPLFVLFDFFKPDESIYQDVVGNFLQGRCT